MYFASKFWLKFNDLFSTQGGYSGFQVTEMIEGFFGVWNSSIPGFFSVRDFLGVLKERIYSGGMMKKQTWVFNFQCFSLCFSITPFWNFYGPQNRHGIFWGLIFGPGIFLGFAGSPRDFFGSWLLAPLNHPRHLKSQVPPPPLGSPPHPKTEKGTKLP